MPKKPKFRPRITRIKLNPEQAVLWCQCFNTGLFTDPNAVPVQVLTASVAGWTICSASRNSGFIQYTTFGAKTFSGVSPGNTSS